MLPTASAKVTGWRAVVLFLLIVALVIPTVLLQAWVASTIWRWFLVPAGFPSLIYAAFVGALLLKEMLFGGAKNATAATSISDAVGNMLGMAFIAPLITLAFAWVLRLIVV